MLMMLHSPSKIYLESLSDPITKYILRLYKLSTLTERNYSRTRHLHSRVGQPATLLAVMFFLCATCNASQQHAPRLFEVTGGIREVNGLYEIRRHPRCPEPDGFTPVKFNTVMYEKCQNSDSDDQTDHYGISRVLGNWVVGVIDSTGSDEMFGPFDDDKIQYRPDHVSYAATPDLVSIWSLCNPPEYCCYWDVRTESTLQIRDATLDQHELALRRVLSRNTFGQLPRSLYHGWLVDGIPDKVEDDGKAQSPNPDRQPSSSPHHVAERLDNPLQPESNATGTESRCCIQ